MCRQFDSGSGHPLQRLNEFNSVREKNRASSYHLYSSTIAFGYCLHYKSENLTPHFFQNSEYIALALTHYLAKYGEEKMKVCHDGCMIKWMLFFMTSLAPCPNKMNCVNSQAETGRHAIPPFQIYGTPKACMERIGEVIRGMPRTKIVEETPDYIHALYTSKIFRFIDDVEFLYNPERNVIEVRSASRVGYGDLGVNRRRVETIRKGYLARSKR